MRDYFKSVNFRKTTITLKASKIKKKKAFMHNKFYSTGPNIGVRYEKNHGMNFAMKKITPPFCHVQNRSITAIHPIFMP